MARKLKTLNLKKNKIKTVSYKKKDEINSNRRESSTKRGYNARWQKARLFFLMQHPLCKHCNDEGFIVSANVVDHIIPHKGDMQLFWDKDNWQALCQKHHNKKTATEDGGFGNKIK